VQDVLAGKRSAQQGVPAADLLLGFLERDASNGFSAIIIIIAAVAVSGVDRQLCLLLGSVLGSRMLES